MRYNKKFGAEDDLVNISVEVSDQAIKDRAKEFGVLRSNTPQYIDIDQRGQTPKVTNFTYNDKLFEKDPWRLYQYRPTKVNEAKGDGKNKAAGRPVFVRETAPDGTVKITEREAYTMPKYSLSDKKDKNTDSHFDTLYRLTRTGSSNQKEYDESLARTQKATKEFEENKYVIEQKAADAQIPPALLAAAMYYMAAGKAEGKGDLNLQNRELVELAEDVFFGNANFSREALQEYLATPEGKTELSAKILKHECDKRGFNIGSLSAVQKQEVLAAFNRKANMPDAEGVQTKELVPVFEKIYKELPGKAREVSWQEDDDNYYDFADVFI